MKIQVHGVPFLSPLRKEVERVYQPVSRSSHVSPLSIHPPKTDIHSKPNKELRARYVPGTVLGAGVPRGRRHGPSLHRTQWERMVPGNIHRGRDSAQRYAGSSCEEEPLCVSSGAGPAMRSTRKSVSIRSMVSISMSS